MLTVKEDARTTNAVLNPDGKTARVVQNDKLRAQRVLYDRGNHLIRVDYEHGYVDESGQFHGSGNMTTVNLTEEFDTLRDTHAQAIVAFLEAIEQGIQKWDLLQGIVEPDVVK